MAETTATPAPPSSANPPAAPAATPGGGVPPKGPSAEAPVSTSGGTGKGSSEAKGSGAEGGSGAPQDRSRVARAFAKAHLQSKGQAVWPKGYVPTDEDRKSIGDSPSEAPPAESTHGKGGGPAAPASSPPAAKAPPKAEGLDAQYAKQETEEGMIALRQADRTLRSWGYTDETLLVLPPETRVHLSQTATNRVAGLRKALGSKSPSQPAKDDRKKADGSKAPPADETGTSDEVDEYDALREATAFLTPAAQAKAMKALERLKEKSGSELDNQLDNELDTETDTTVRPESPRPVRLSPEQAEVAKENLDIARDLLTREFPAAKDDAVWNEVQQEAAKRAGNPAGVLLRPKVLLDALRDGAAIVNFRHIKRAKGAPDGTGTMSVSPSGHTAGSTPSPRRLTDEEWSSTAMRAAIDSKGNPELNKTLLAKYRSEAAARPAP